MDHVDDNQGINHKELERARGFLIYVSRTYRPFKPYLRGLHKTIDIWRPHRDQDGWKIMEAVLAAKYDVGVCNPQEPVEFVKPVPRLKSDFHRLQQLTSEEAPPKVIRRQSKAGVVCYGFADASGKGFGSAIEVEGVLHSEYGTWNAEIESEHSNYKEMRNLVNVVENAYEQGLLKNTELYLFTDNFVAECAYYNGGSNTNKHLNELVFRLWKLQMGGDFELFVYHVAGTRMIESGIDGLSRGDMGTGVSRGEAIGTFVPLHQTPEERSPGVEAWVRSWRDKEKGDLHTMSPEDWFDKHTDEGNYLWIVSPIAGETAVEQLCGHFHGCSTSLHIIVIPRLCTCHFRKQLLKVSDLLLTIEAKYSFWPSNMHEPLLLSICLPLLPPLPRFNPWKFKHTGLLEDTVRDVQRMQTTCDQVDWGVLQQLLVQARKVPSMSASLAQSLLQATSAG